MMTYEHLILDMTPPEMRGKPGETIRHDNCGYCRRHVNVNAHNL